MKNWRPFLIQAPAFDDSGAHGASTSDDDFDDAADDALVEEGEAELEDLEEEEEPADSDSDEEEQSDEDQDDLEDEEEEVDEEEEEAPAGFRFKDPKTGDFDFKRINKVVGGPELEKAFKEQTATITRTSQENKQLREQLSSPEIVERQNKAGFLDHLMQTHPGIRQEVLRILEGGAAPQNQNLAGMGEIPGLNPDDPLAPVVRELAATVHALKNRHQESDRQRQIEEQDRQFVSGLRSARAKFKELVGREATEEETTLVAKRMQESRFLNGAAFVPDLFLEQIRAAERQRLLEQRKVKRGLPKTGSSGRRPAATAKRRSKEEDQDDLWAEHMSGGIED